MKWGNVKLRDAATIVNGYAFKSSNMKDEYLPGYRPVVKIGNISSSGMLDLSSVQYHEFTRELKPFNIKKDDVLIAMTGATVGKVSVSTYNDLLLNQRVALIRPKEELINQRFLYHSLCNPLFYDYCQFTAGGGAQGNISPSQILEYQIPLPPLPIQQQIADTLDKADALRRKDQELLDKYDELAQAVFYEMFGDISINSKNWNIVQIRSIAQEVKYGTSSPAAASGSYPYLRMNNISYSGELLLDDLKYISASEKEFEKYGTRYGDLLFNRTNSKDLVGKTTIVDTETPMIIAGYLIRVRFNDQANPWYVSTFMNSTHMKKVLRNKCKSIIGMANINAQELQDFDIPLPPKELQDSFAEKLSHIKKQQSIVKKTQSKSSAYFNQCLYNYFV